MARKIVNISEAGTSTQFGANDTDYINKYLTGVDQSGADPVPIATTTTYDSTKLGIYNPGRTFKYNFVGSAITADRSITWPLLTFNDEVVTKAAPQVITGKTIDYNNNTILNLPTSTGGGGTPADLRGVMTADVVVYKDGTTYNAKKSIDQTIVSTNTNPRTVIQDAFNYRGPTGTTTVYIAPADYIMASGFTSLTIPIDTYVHCASSAVFTVPSAYSASCFTVNSAYSGCLVGGIIQEATPKSKNWRGVNINNTDSNGIAFFKVKDMYIYQPGVGLKINASGSSASFVNACWFTDILIDGPRVGVSFSAITGGEIKGNTFTNVGIQCDVGVTTEGFQDIRTSSNVFMNSYVWDMDPTGSEANILSGVDHTVIIGNGMTGHAGTFTDSGTATARLGN